MVICHWNGLAIADKVNREGMAWPRVVLGRHPVIITMVIGLGLGGFIKMPVEMPLAHMACTVSGLFKEKGQGEFTFSEMDLAIFRNPSENPVAIRSTTG